MSVQIDKEDYSLADIIHKELLSVKHVTFAGVPPPHPLIKTLTVRVHTDGYKPTRALLDASELSQKKVSDLLKLARQMFPTTLAKSSSEDEPKQVSSERVDTAQST